MRTLRRYLTLVALMFWLGGFTFYASVVVPVGASVSSHERQGFITRQVTVHLNRIAVVALAVLLGEVWLTADPSRRRQRVRAALWLLMTLAQAALFWLHAYLDALLQVRGRIILDREAFEPAHRTYLWIHTVQWTAGLLFIALMLQAWRNEDGQARQ